MGRPILFCCPLTGLNVQGYVKAEPADDGSNQYEGVECAACRQTHLVNITTGKLPSDEGRE